jgi:prepilin-type N-terminal cleavage/methylation domain-containing protein
MSVYRDRKQSPNCKAKGFTLVELLITISVIAILTGALLSVLNPRGIQAKARDSQRVSDLSKVKVALENYFSDNRAYPVAVNWIYIYVDEATPTAVSTALKPNYVNTLPKDPKQSGSLCSNVTKWRGYGYKSLTGTTYALVTNMETAAMASTVCPFAAPAQCNGCNIDGTVYYAIAD